MSTGKVVQDQNLERQMGCMAGFLQLFDRHQILTGKRLYSTKRLPPTKVTFYYNAAKFFFFFFFFRGSNPKGIYSSLVFSFDSVSLRLPMRHRIRRRNLPRRFQLNWENLNSLW